MQVVVKVEVEMKLARVMLVVAIISDIKPLTIGFFLYHHKMKQTFQPRRRASEQEKPEPGYREETRGSASSFEIYILAKNNY